MNTDDINKLVALLSDLLPDKAKAELLRAEIRKHISKRWHPITVVLRDELTKADRWKVKPRGDPTKGFKKGWGEYQKKKQQGLIE